MQIGQARTDMEDDSKKELVMEPSECRKLLRRNIRF